MWVYLTCPKNSNIDTNNTSTDVIVLSVLLILSKTVSIRLVYMNNRTFVQEQMLLLNAAESYIRSVFGAQSKMCDGAFFEIRLGFLAANFFRRKYLSQMCNWVRNMALYMF